MDPVDGSTQSAASACGAQKCHPLRQSAQPVNPDREAWRHPHGCATQRLPVTVAARALRVLLLSGPADDRTVCPLHTTHWLLSISVSGANHLGAHGFLRTTGWF